MCVKAFLLGAEDYLLKLELDKDRLIALPRFNITKVLI